MPERNPSNQKPIEPISIYAPEGTIVQTGPAHDDDILHLPCGARLILINTGKQDVLGHLKLEWIVNDEDKLPCYIQIPENIRGIILNALKGIEKYCTLMNSGLTASVRKRMGFGGEAIIREQEIENLPTAKQKLLSELFKELEKIASANPFD